MTTQSADIEAVREADLDDPSGRLAAYTARTQTPLDLLALLTLWIVLVPPGDFGDASTIALLARVGLSVVYGIDMAIRTTLARRHWDYVRTNPLSLLVVVIPAVRIIFSLRLVRSLFRRGHLERFLVAASVLVLNGAIVVYLFERDAKGSNIHTLGQSVWWAVTTVTTVGYGDYSLVTAGGRIAASFIMAIGILTLAVITAQVASSFVDQAARRRASSTPAEPATPEVSLADIAQRLARIRRASSVLVDKTRMTLSKCSAIPVWTQPDLATSSWSQYRTSRQNDAPGHGSARTNRHLCARGALHTYRRLWARLNRCGGCRYGAGGYEASGTKPSLCAHARSVRGGWELQHLPRLPSP